MREYNGYTFEGDTGGLAQLKQVPKGNNRYVLVQDYFEPNMHIAVRLLRILQDLYFTQCILETPILTQHI